MALVVIALCAVFAAPAPAATFCVPAASASCAGTDEATVTDAINATNATGSHDVIQIAAKSTPYAEDLPPVNTGRPVDIVGAGPDKTVLRPLTQGDTETTLTINDPNSTVSNLGIALARGSGGGTGTVERGLTLNGSATPGAHATNVAITSPDPVKNSFGVVFSSPNDRFSGGTVTLPNVTAPDSNIGTAGAGTVEDSRITADDGTLGAALVQRTRINADFRGLAATGGGSRYEDVTVVLTGAAPNAIGLDAPGFVLPVNVTARHLTLVGNGDPSNIGASCSSGGFPAQPCSLNLDGVVIRGFAKDLSRSANGADASIAIDYSDYDPAKVTDMNSPGGTGAITPGPHNLNVDPGFVSSGPTNPAAFHLLATSPLIDAGNPSLPGDESTTDGDGASRVAAGRNTAPAVSDIGAFEFQPHAPSAAAVAPSTGKVGQSLVFDASGSSDPDAGDALSYAWSFDDGAAAGGPVVTHAFATAGIHSANVTATDLSHRTATAMVFVNISAPPAVLSLLKSADHAAARVRGRAGFTISAVNAGDAAIGIRSLSDRLPAGFNYVPGSTTLNGRLVTDPRVHGRSLTWISPLRRVKTHRGRICHGHGASRHCHTGTIRTRGARVALSTPAHGTLRLHLLTIAAKKAGRYTNHASADAGPAVQVLTQAASATVRVKQ